MKVSPMRIKRKKPYEKVEIQSENEVEETLRVVTHIKKEER